LEFFTDQLCGRLGRLAEGEVEYVSNGNLKIVHLLVALKLVLANPLLHLCQIIKVQMGHSRKLCQGVTVFDHEFDVGLLDEAFEVHWNLLFHGIGAL